MNKLKSDGCGSVQDDTIPLLLTNGYQCYDVFKSMPVPGIFTFEQGSRFHGFVHVRIADGVFAPSAVVCSSEFINVLVKVDDWLLPFLDITSFVQKHEDASFESKLLKCAIGSRAGYSIFLKTLDSAFSEQQKCAYDIGWLPEDASHVVIQSSACFSRVVEIDDASAITEDTEAWFANTLDLQQVDTDPIGINRFYENASTPRIRFILQSRMGLVRNSKSIERLVGSVAAIELCLLRPREDMSHSSTTTTTALSTTALLPIKPPNEQRFIYSEAGQIDMITPTKSISHTDGVHAAVASAILDGWQLQLFLSARSPKSIQELLTCFTPTPTIIVKQRLLMLFHTSSHSPTSVCTKQASFLLQLFGTTLLYDSNTRTCKMYNNHATFKLSDSYASQCVQELIERSERADNAVPTKRLRQALRNCSAPT